VGVGAQTHYEVLGIDEHATSDQIRSAWKTLIQVWHPDRFKGEMRARAEEMTKAVNAAYTCLRDPSARWLYDQELRVGRRGAAPDADSWTETASDTSWQAPEEARSPSPESPSVAGDAMFVCLSLVLATVSAYCGVALFVDDFNDLPAVVNFVGAVIAGGVLQGIWWGGDPEEDEDAIPKLRSADGPQSLLAVGIAVAIFLVADWTLSVGPLSWVTVQRCTSSYEDDGWSPEDARERCWGIKRAGNLNLSGGTG
jgi:hypothetical protein